MNALQLAQELEIVSWKDAQDEAAAMLRLQHAEIQEWRNVFGFLGTPNELGNEWNALKETNSRQHCELLLAHEAIVKLRGAMKRQLWYTGQLEAIVYDEGEQAETHEIVAQSEQALADTEEFK